MKRLFCDRCDKEIQQTSTDVSMDVTSLGQYHISASVTVKRNGAFLKADLCLNCIIDIFASLDNRPQQAAPEETVSKQKA